MTTSLTSPAPDRHCPCLACHLEAAVASRGCDGTLRHTDAWITAMPGNWMWLQELLQCGGGGCDCTVVTDVLADGPRPGSRAYDPRIICPSTWADENGWDAEDIWLDEEDRGDLPCSPDCPCRGDC